MDDADDGGGHLTIRGRRRRDAAEHAEALHACAGLCDPGRHSHGRPAAGLRDRRPSPALLSVCRPHPGETLMPTAVYELKDTLLKVEHVSVRLGGAPILRDVNVEIRDIVR